MPCDLSKEQQKEIIGEILLVINQMQNEAWNCTAVFLHAIERCKAVLSSEHAQRHGENLLMSFEQKIEVF